MTGFRTNICSIALTLLLIVGFFYLQPSKASYVIQNRSWSLRTKVNRPFYGMGKICVIVIENVNIFTIYERLFENVMTILSITYEDKTKMPGKDRKCLVYL